MKQTTFASLAFERKKKQTRRERFLAQMEAVVPWAALLAVIEPHYPTTGRRGRPPMPLATMLRERRDWSATDFMAYRRGYCALVTEMDLALGQLVCFLEEQRLLDNTLLVFSSDHGDFCGDHGITHKNAAYYDEVMRVPLILHWPNALGAERHDVSGLVEMVDVLPTLLGLCRSHIPPVMAGRSYAADLIAGRLPEGRDDVFAFHGPGHAMLRTAEHKYLRYGDGAEVLYDLREDPIEVRNRVADPDCRAVLDRLRWRMLSRALDACRSPRPRRNPF